MLSDISVSFPSKKFLKVEKKSYISKNVWSFLKSMHEMVKSLYCETLTSRHLLAQS